MSHEVVIDFWFNEIEPKAYWLKDPEFDRMIVDRFSQLHRQAANCELFTWRRSPLGRLAEIIVLDQFSRNMFRNSPLAFAFDDLALALSQEAIAAAAALTASQKAFMYMPFMHSESLLIHEQAVELFSEPGLESNLDFEMKHKAIIDRFGRYPHRNLVLGRESTAGELAFLEGPGSSF